MLSLENMSTRTNGRIKKRGKRMDQTAIRTSVNLRLAKRAILPESLYTTIPLIPKRGIRISASIVSANAAPAATISITLNQIICRQLAASNAQDFLARANFFDAAIFSVPSNGILC